MDNQTQTPTITNRHTNTHTHINTHMCTANIFFDYRCCPPPSPCPYTFHLWCDADSTQGRFHVYLTKVMSLEAAAALMWRLGCRTELLQSKARANVPTELWDTHDEEDVIQYIWRDRKYTFTLNMLLGNWYSSQCSCFNFNSINSKNCQYRDNSLALNG